MAYVKSEVFNYQSSAFVKPEDAPDDWAPDAQAVESALKYFNLAFIVSAVSAGLMFIVMIFYKLGKKEHAEIVEKLKELGLKQGNEQVVAEEVGIAEISKQIEEAEEERIAEGEVMNDADVKEEKDNEAKDGSDGSDDNSNDLKF